MPRLGAAEVRFTERADGDMRGAAPRRAVVDRPWVVPRQVHGGDVVVVTAPGVGDGMPADALVTARDDVAVAVLTADCAPVALASAEGIVAVAHAGWRGLTAGVLESTVEVMQKQGAGEIEAALGPCIHAPCYEFSPGDLDEVATRVGEQVRATTDAGAPALDVPAAVRAALERVGVRLVHDAGVCTACSTAHWSHRARGDLPRQAAVVWWP